MTALYKAGFPTTEEQVTRLVEAFHLLDVDNSGEMDVEELSTVFKFLGLKMTPDRVQEIAVFDEFDEDGSGSIQVEEFLMLATKMKIRVHDTDIKVMKALLAASNSNGANG